jgi:hypothetical protein
MMSLYKFLENANWLHTSKNNYNFKALNNLAPVYLQELANAHQPTRALRSEDLQLLMAPRIRTKTYGERRVDKSAIPVK